MPEGRLFEIIYYLLDKGKSTAPELSKKFGVSVRTIYRDLDTLSSAGIPVFTQQGKGGGIEILSEYTIDRSMLSEDERSKILTGLQTLSAADDRQAEQLLTKLSALFKSSGSSWIEVDFSNWAKGDSGAETFNLIKKAVFSKHVLSFRYHGANGICSRRNAEPLKLVFKGRDWYMYGFCRLRNDFRFFKLTRIRDIKIETERFSREAPARALAEESYLPPEMVKVLLKFDKSAAFRVFDEFPERAEEAADGHIYVRTELPKDENILYGYLFSFMDSAELIEPEELRQLVKKKLADMRSLYAGSGG